ncbi:MAG: hypothetical protein ACP5D2_04425 [Candidatus Nanoarchaeia archaeon]
MRFKGLGCLVLLASLLGCVDKQALDILEQEVMPCCTYSGEKQAVGQIINNIRENKLLARDAEPLLRRYGYEVEHPDKYREAVDRLVR